jgi:polyisoprenoid-binding protein YceI
MLIRTGIVAGALGAGVVGVLGFALAAPSAQSGELAATGAYKVDPVHTSVVFRIKHLDTAWFYGRFDEMTGMLNYDPADPSASSLNLEVKIESVNSGNGRRDGHLKSSDFFSSKQFPTATFVSSSFAPAAEGVYEIAGDLTIKGVTRPVTARLEKTGQSQGERGTVIGFETTFDIKRSEFGITYGPESLGEDVRMIVSIEAGAR